MRKPVKGYPFYNPYTKNIQAFIPIKKRSKNSTTIYQVEPFPLHLVYLLINNVHFLSSQIWNRLNFFIFFPYHHSCIKFELY